jgi:hypothetical protein
MRRDLVIKHERCWFLIRGRFLVGLLIRGRFLVCEMLASLLITLYLTRLLIVLELMQNCGYLV